MCVYVGRSIHVDHI